MNKSSLYFPFIVIGILIFFYCNPKNKNIDEANIINTPQNLEATVWAESPMFYNPTNIDVDIKGRIWLTEAVDYRNYNHDTTKFLFHPKGDRIVILEDCNGDGKADSSKVFVQDEDLIAPLGIAVIGNKVVVSCSPNIIVYTDEDGDDRPDKKEIFLTGFGGKDHDHGVHSTITGPDGKWYFNVGNAGPDIVTDKTGWTLRAGSMYNSGTQYNSMNRAELKSDDGKIWTGGLALRINSDGTGLKVLAYNFRNSFEIALDSYGNIWQSDNDDEVDACRTSWVIEGGNAGFFSNTGTRSWRADRRPGQSMQISHWHQEDPGIMQAGDIYGAGAPTGMVINESDLLGKQNRGLLLSADAGRNIIFGYRPKAKGAGFDFHDRIPFLTSLSNDNEHYRWNKVDSLDKSKWFRPSDITVGTDGAIYVADWYDPIVGGHQILDKRGYGRIYRISPKEKKLTTPVFNLDKTEDQIKALLNPAINVRNQGFERLKKQGEKVIPEVKKILSEENPYYRARAVWLLSQLGNQGIAEVKSLSKDSDVNIRTVSFRALRQSDPENILQYAELYANDESPAVRREVAISMRDIPLSKCKSIILKLIDRLDSEDQAYLNAISIALQGKQDEFYTILIKHYNLNSEDSKEWSPQLVAIVNEIHPAEAVVPIAKRIRDNTLSVQERKKSLVTLAFIPSKKAANAMIHLQQNQVESHELNNLVQWWLIFRKSNDWNSFLRQWKVDKALLPQPQPELLMMQKVVEDSLVSLKKRLDAALELTKKESGKLRLVYLLITNKIPDTIVWAIKKQINEEKDRNLNVLLKRFFNTTERKTSFSADSIAHLNGDPNLGKTLFVSKCAVCHKVDDLGNEIGPNLTNIRTKFDKEVIIADIINPSSKVNFDFEPYLIMLKNGSAIYGLLLSDGTVITVMDTYGRRFFIDASQIEFKRKLNNYSIMPEPTQIPINSQDISDIVSFLFKTNKNNTF